MGKYWLPKNYINTIPKDQYNVFNFQKLMEETKKRIDDYDPSWRKEEKLLVNFQSKMNKSGLLHPTPIYGDEYKRKVIGYSTSILDHEGVFKSKKEIREKDYINLWKALPKEKLPDELDSMPGIMDFNGFQDYINYMLTPELDLYDFIPPLKEAVLRINRNRYIYYDNVMWDEEVGAISCHIEDYCFNTFAGWHLNGTGDAVFILTPVANPKEGEGYYTWNADVLHYKPVSEIIKESMNILKKNLSYEEYQYMEMVGIPMIDDNMDVVDARSLASHFFYGIGYTNYCLSKHQARAKRHKRVGGQSQTRYKDVGGEVDPKKRQVIRAVGTSGIEIKSVKVPKKSTKKEVVRTYHLAQWTSRAHKRHLKDGRVIFVKASVHRRKCLMNTEYSEMKPQVQLEVV